MRTFLLCLGLAACVTPSGDDPGETDAPDTEPDTDRGVDTSESDAPVDPPDTDDADDTDESDAPDTDDDAVLPTFTRVRDEVLLPSCALSSCHGKATGAPGGLRLGNARGADHAELVDVPATLAVGETLVIPGDPDDSYLVKKIEDADDIVGQAMPPGVTLSADQRALVRAWIAAGALDD